MSGFAETVRIDGVVQQNPDGETVSQLPPVALIAVAVKLKAVPVLAMVST